MATVKYAGMAIAVLALIFLGFKVATWRAEALQLSEARKVAEDAKTELRHQIERTVEADKQRLAMQEKLTQAQEMLAKKLGTTLKAIQDNVPKNSGCDIPDPVASQLSRLRDGQ